MPGLPAHPTAGQATLESGVNPLIGLCHGHGRRAQRATPVSPRSVGVLACVRVVCECSYATAVLDFPQPLRIQSVGMCA